MTVQVWYPSALDAYATVGAKQKAFIESIPVSAILINGQMAEHISVLDRGFQYGDGLFETLRVVDGEPCHWTLHMARLSAGCEKLGITPPNPALLLTEARSLCADKVDIVLKIIVTRGESERGYAPSAQAKATRVLSLSPAPTFPQTYFREGVRVRLCDTRLGSNPALAGIKHLNRLEQVLARAELNKKWADTGIAEGLMCDADKNNNNVIEGTMSNLFCVQDNAGTPKLKTPRLDQCGVAGITRDRVMTFACALDIPVQETVLSVDDLYKSQELFLCNTLIGIWPVRQLEGQTFAVGPVTRQLSAALEAAND